LARFDDRSLKRAPRGRIVASTAIRLKGFSCAPHRAPERSSLFRPPALAHRAYVFADDDLFRPVVCRQPEAAPTVTRRGQTRRFPRGGAQKRDGVSQCDAFNSTPASEYSRRATRAMVLSW